MIKKTINNKNYEIANTNNSDINGKYKVMCNTHGDIWFLVRHAQTLKEARAYMQQHATHGYTM